jgi:pimeloyl-ACP methyl ester carboxylesterase
MSTWQDGFVEANGIRLHYTRTGGDRRPIVFAHGITDNGRGYSRLVQVLEPYYDCVMVDARGHGKSDKPESGYAPRDHAADLAGLIRGLELDRPVIMGHSMGGADAAVLLAEYPDLVSAAVLEDPAWEWPGVEEQADAARRELYTAWRATAEARSGQSAASIITQGKLDHANWAVEEFDDWAEAKLQVAPQALEFVLHPRTDWQELVAQFQVPTLIIYGDPALGSILGPDMAAVAQQQNRLVTALNVPGAGHNIRREQFEVFAWAVREFLAMAGRRQPVAV